MAHIRLVLAVVALSMSLTVAFAQAPICLSPNASVTEAAAAAPQGPRCATLREALSVVSRGATLTRPVPTPHVLSREEALAALRDGGPASMTWLGHSSFLIRAGGRPFLLDPNALRLAGPWPRPTAVCGSVRLPSLAWDAIVPRISPLGGV